MLFGPILQTRGGEAWSRQGAPWGPRPPAPGASVSNLWEVPAACIASVQQGQLPRPHGAAPCPGGCDPCFGLAAFPSCSMEGEESGRVGPASWVEVTCGVHSTGSRCFASGPGSWQVALGSRQPVRCGWPELATEKVLDGCSVCLLGMLVLWCLLRGQRDLPGFRADVATSGVPCAPGRNRKVVSHTARLSGMGRGLLHGSVRGWSAGRGWAGGEGTHAGLGLAWFEGLHRGRQWADPTRDCPLWAGTQ